MADWLGTRGRGEHTAATEANARLTALAGSVLFVLLAALGVTIVGIHRLLTAHACLGLLLVGPLAVKLGSTGWRFVQYYRGNADFRRAGPPAPLLRALAPVVVLTTLTVFGTGVALLFLQPARASAVVTVHKVSFIVWFAVMTVHVVAYAPRAVQRTVADIAGWGPPAALATRTRRQVLVAASVVAGIGLGLAGIGWIHPWTVWLAHRGGG